MHFFNLFILIQFKQKPLYPSFSLKKRNKLCSHWRLDYSGNWSSWGGTGGWSTKLIWWIWRDQELAFKSWSSHRVCQGVLFGFFKQAFLYFIGSNLHCEIVWVSLDYFLLSGHILIVIRFVNPVHIQVETST